MQGTPWLWEVLSAGGLGLLIGLEREHARLVPGTRIIADPHAKGARTFALIALLGYGAALAGDRYPALPLMALLSLGLILAALHLRREQPAAQAVKEPAVVTAETPEDEETPPPAPHGEDVTTEVAALCTAVLGMLVHGHLEAAVMIGLLVTMVLIVKPWIRVMVPRLRREELTGTLQLLVAVLIILPVVPDRNLSLWGPLSDVLNPRSVVLFVVLIAGVSYAGYFSVRLLGAQRGLGVTGLVGGLASSTATTMALGQRARKTAALAGPAALGTLLACAVMAVRVCGVAYVVHRPLGRQLLYPTGAMLLGYVIAVAVLALLNRRERGHKTGEPPLPLDNPFALGPALKFGVLYVLTLLLARLLRHYLGTGGLYLASFLSGLADVDAITLAAARMTKDGGETLTVGVTAVVLAVAANTAVKAGLGLSAGGRAFGVRVMAGQALALVMGGLGLVWLWLG